MTQSKMNYYSGAGLDRAEHRRRDGNWLESELESADCRVMVLHRSHHFVTSQSEPCWLSGPEAAGWLADGHQSAFLGQIEGRSVIAVDLSEIASPETLPPLAGRGSFRDLRAFGPDLPRDQGALLAYARGLLYWHQRHRYCGICGSPTESAEAGHVRRCLNRNCDGLSFPRTDPAVIMLIHDGAGSCVLGRQKSWPPGMHSVLAGFVEPGESLEEAVAREIREEVGLVLDVAEVVYRSSQPWPFPASIMLGFQARTAHAELNVDQRELESARWFTREELMRSTEDESFRLPRRDSIARRLVDEWLDGKD